MMRADRVGHDVPQHRPPPVPPITRTAWTYSRVRRVSASPRTSRAGASQRESRTMIMTTAGSG